MKKTNLFLFFLFGSLGLMAQVPNAGFESWGSSYSAPTEPVNYVTANVLASPYVSTSNPTSVTQATGVYAYSGTYAAKITTVKLVSNPTSGQVPDTVGLALLGSIQITPSVALKSGIAFTQRMTSLNFYYMYQAASSDKGAAAAYLTKWNGTSRDTIADALQVFSGSMSSYSLASVPFVYRSAFPSSTTPDSLHIYFLSSAKPWIKTVTSGPFLGSSLWVDDASLVGIMEYNKNRIVIKGFPNPAKDEFSIELENNVTMVTLSVFDVTGSEISRHQYNSKTIRVNTSDLPNGIYLYKLLGKENELLGNGKMVVNR